MKILFTKIKTGDILKKIEKRQGKSMDFQAIWETVKTYFSENIWNILLFFAVLIVGLILITLLNKLFRKIMSKTKMERVTQKFIANAIKLGLYLILVLILLNIVGVEITGILTALSAVLLAIGMALQSNIANFANGIIIVSAKLYTLLWMTVLRHLKSNGTLKREKRWAHVAQKPLSL